MEITCHKCLYLTFIIDSIFFNSGIRSTAFVGTNANVKFVDMPRVARLDIFAGGKFDITSLTVGFDMI